jgi:mRNA-degrading endonuclease RelE of RelBE toxin-antitoxin system
VASVHVEVSRRAERDLRALSPPDRRRAAVALSGALARDPLPANADDRALAERAPWRRLRVGELRVLYRKLEPGELPDIQRGRYVARIVHRGDLERAITTLP